MGVGTRLTGSLRVSLFLAIAMSVCDTNAALGVGVLPAGSMGNSAVEVDNASRFVQRKGALLEALSCGIDKSKKGR